MPTIIAGNNCPADPAKILWGPNDTRLSNPTIIDMVYPVLLRHQTSGIDKTAKLRLAAIKGPTLAGVSVSGATSCKQGHILNCELKCYISSRASLGKACYSSVNYIVKCVKNEIERKLMLRIKYL